MALSELAIERATGALKSDVGATVGAGHESVVVHFAEHGRSFIDEDAWFTQWLVDEVQQYFHDTFVDTTWPACPRHPNHPLWFRDDCWWCDGDRIATFGQLAFSCKGDTGAHGDREAGVDTGNDRVLRR